MADVSQRLSALKDETLATFEEWFVAQVQSASSSTPPSLATTHHTPRQQAGHLTLHSPGYLLPSLQDPSAAAAVEPAASDAGDILDDGEAFDKLEMERVATDDPDSLAYFNAQKRMRGTTRSNRHRRK